MMDTNASFKEREHHGDLGKLLIISGKSLNSVLVDLLYTVAFIILVEIAVFEAHRVGFALTFGEGEDNAGV